MKIKPIVFSSQFIVISIFLLLTCFLSAVNAETVFFTDAVTYTNPRWNETVTLEKGAYQTTDGTSGSIIQEPACFDLASQGPHVTYVNFNNYGCIITWEKDSLVTRINIEVRNITCPVGVTAVDSTGSCLNPNNKFLSANDLVINFSDAQQCDTETGATSPTIYTKYPINTFNGNKYRLEVDFAQTGLSPLKFTRYYSSNKNQTYDVGTNWSHSYTTSLTANIHTEATPYVSGDSNFSSLNSTAQLACENGWNDIKATYNQPALASSTAAYLGSTCNIQDANGNALGSIAVRDNSTGGVSPNPPQDNIVIERANGNTIVFTLTNSVWTPPTDSDVSLVQTASGYTLTTAQDTVEEYDLEGKLVSTTDRKGMQQVLSYNVTTGLLESVTDSLGKSLNFTYVGSNINTVTLPDNTQLVYGYDANNNLSTVKREDNTVKTYVYENTAFPNALTGIIDENNQRYMTFSYDALGRAVTSELGDGTSFSAEKVTVAFIDDATSTVTDSLGQLRTYRFTTINGEKKLTDIEGAPCGSCGGSATHTTYDANGYVASSTDFNGNVTTFINNARGLQTSRTEATGTTDQRVITTTWHPAYPLPLKVTHPTNVTDFTYDAQGNVLTRTQTDTTNSKTRTWTYTYNNYGQVLSIDGARTDVSDITTYAYDSNGNIVSVTHASGHVTQITAYDARNKPLTLIDANGLTTQLAYDVRGRLLTRTVTGDGTSLTTTLSYDGVGNLKTIHLPGGQSLTYDYDAAHRLTGITDQVGNSITYTLDAMGNRLKEDTLDPVNTLVRTRSQVFNMLSQLTQRVGAQTQTTSYSYDANGNQLTTTDAATKTTAYAFDALNRVMSMTDPLTGNVTYSYDAQGNLASANDANGITTSYVYDGLNNRISQASLDTGTTTYTYDAAGNVLTHTDAKTQTTAYQYDALNRLVLTSYHDGTTVAYSYDQGVKQVSRLTGITTTSVSNGSSSLSYRYDVFGRMVNKTQNVNGISLTTAYAYDTQGRLNSMTYPSGSVVSYSYVNGQLSGLSLNGQTVLNNINYEAFSSVKGWIWGNGSVHNRGFDLDGQLISQSLANDTRTLGYDAKGNITRIDDANVNQLFGYDELNRLTAANDARFNQTFSYDANGNRLSLTTSAAIDTYGYAASNTNRLTSISGATVKTYQYDANGNITHDGLHGYTYDARNRLINIDTTATYQHNALGQRVQKKASGNITQFYYNEQGQLIAEANSTGFVTKEYVYFNGQPIAISNNAPASTTQYLLNTVNSTNDTATWQVDTALHTITINAPSEGLSGTYTVAANDWIEDVDVGQPIRQFALSVNTLDGRLVVGLLSIENASLTGRFFIYTQPTTPLYLGNFEFTGLANTTLNGTETYSGTPATLQWDALQSTLSLTEYSGAMTGSYPVAAEDVFNMTTVNGNTTLIFYTDVQQRLLSAVVTENSGYASAKAFAQLGDMRLADYAGSVTNPTQSTLHYIHTDHLGTPRVITDENNTPLWSWHSDPFGKTVPNEDVDGDGVNFEFNLRFAGQYFDKETNLHYNYFRDYDPSTGRYVQSDPIGLAGGLNTYGYVGGNPLSYVDPYGLLVDTNNTYLKHASKIRYGLGPITLGIGIGGLVADALMPGYTSVVDIPGLTAANDEQMCRKPDGDDPCKKKLKDLKNLWIGIRDRKNRSLPKNILRKLADRYNKEREDFMKSCPNWGNFPPMNRFNPFE